MPVAADRKPHLEPNGVPVAPAGTLTATFPSPSPPALWSGISHAGGLDCLESIQASISLSNQATVLPPSCLGAGKLAAWIIL